MGTSDPAVVLLSGGLDSATVLAIARNEGYDLHALVVDYGQRHRHELEAAKNLARAAGVPFRVMPLDLRVFGGSALTDDIDVPTAEMNLKCKRTSRYVCPGPQLDLLRWARLRGDHWAKFVPRCEC